MTQTLTQMTLDQVRQAAPSAFAVEKFHERSERYAFIPTSAVIEHMLSMGFQIFSASQWKTRILAKQDFTKHMIRFRHESSDLHVGDSFPEVVLVNGHDGSSAYKLMGGIFKLVCSNGLVIADSMIGAIHVKHVGNIVEQVAKGSIEIVDQMPKVIDAVDRWRQIQLTMPEQKLFAEAAHTIRFADAEGHVNTPIQSTQLLTARRREDNTNDLWNVFNRVQENTIKGGLTAQNRETSRNTTTKKINGIDQDLRLNKALWTLAEKMAEIKGAA